VAAGRGIVHDDADAFLSPSVAMAEPSRTGQVDMNDQCVAKFPAWTASAWARHTKSHPAGRTPGDARVGLSADLPVNVAAHFMPVRAQSAPDGSN